MLDELGLAEPAQRGREREGLRAAIDREQRQLLVSAARVARPGACAPAFASRFEPLPLYRAS